MTDSEEIHYSVADAEDLGELRCAAIFPSRLRVVFGANHHALQMKNSWKVVPARTSFYFSVL